MQKVREKVYLSSPNPFTDVPVPVVVPQPMHTANVVEEIEQHYVANAINEIEHYWRYRWLSLIGWLLCCLFFLVIPAIIGVPLIFAGWAYRQMFLMRLWKTIPENIARTKPEKVLFLQIPLFNLYWQFVVIYGLGVDINKALEKQRNSYRVNETLGLVTCVFPIIPFLLYFYLRSCKEGAIALLKGQQ